MAQCILARWRTVTVMGSRFLVHFTRNNLGSRAHTSSFSVAIWQRTMVVARTYTKPISQFATLRIQSAAPVYVESMEPSRMPNSLQHPESDRTFAHIELHLRNGQQQDEPDIDVTYDNNDLVINSVNPDVIIKAWLPFSCSIDANLTDSETQPPSELCVSKMEGGYINFSLQTGSCFLKGVKSTPIVGTSTSGHLVVDSMQGDVKFRTDGGSIFAQRIQSLELDVSTKSGNVGVEALYGDICRIMTISGNILIGDAHGILSLHSESGDVILGTLDANAMVASNTGNIKAHIAREQNSTLSSKTGSVSCFLSDTTKNITESISSDTDLQTTIIHFINDKRKEKELILRHMAEKLLMGRQSFMEASMAKVKLLEDIRGLWPDSKASFTK
eukprot:gene4743-6830_t